MTTEDEGVPFVPGLVAARTADAPNALAVASSDITLTYAQLDSQATRLACQLRSLGVGPNVVVGLSTERSGAFLIGALGILKAGGAYLPLDPAQPAERAAYMAYETKVAAIVASPQTAARLSTVDAPVVVLDPHASEPAFTSTTPPVATVTSQQLAYVIYTSGSTGRPKGVEITHGSLRNLVLWHRRAFSVRAGDRATQMASPGFDAAVWEIWPYLASGSSLHVPDDTTRRSPALLRDWLVAQQITISFAVTPVAERLLEMTWPTETKLRLLLTGGDTLNRYPPAGLPFGVVNNYGPTESTVVVTSGLVPAASGSAVPPTIGRPIANVDVHILDQDLRPVPAGVAGEMCIAGAGLARGYVNNPDATAERFVQTPFSDERLYRTGDLARYEPDGQIAFLGRLDEQIKIRGHRIEPVEVVRALIGHPAIEAGAVLAHDDEPGIRRLVAYIVLKPGQTPTSSALSGYLRARLPEYMVPAAFVRVDELPLTSNGKIDRAALPRPTAVSVLQGDKPRRPRSAVEERVATILSELLRVGEIELDENFFLLGGHSLLGAQVIARLRETFAVDVSLRSLFGAPTVAGISAEIERLIDEEVAALSESEVRRLAAADAPGNQC